MDKVIIVDIDNTILSQIPRKQKILQKLFKYNVSYEQLKIDFSLEKVFEDIAQIKQRPVREIRTEFEEEFFSFKYYDPEMFDVIDNSNSILSELSKYANIVYLTSRDTRLQKETQRQLQEKGFPFPDNKNHHLIFAPVEESSLDNFEEKSYKAKANKIRSLLYTAEVVISIGDRASDSAAAYVNKVPSIIYGLHEESQVIDRISTLLGEKDIDEYGIACINNWDDICLYVKHCLGIITDINDICATHATNYADWLSDLDQKSSLILVIATFCAAIFLNTLSGTTNYNIKIIIILSFIGFIASLLSMCFAIKSFSSRVTHSSELIGNLLGLNLASRISKKDVYAPIKEREKVSKTTFSATASAKYLLKRYSTLEKNSVMSKNLFNLRASNYEKIYPEFFAKTLLLCSILILLLIGILTFYSNYITELEPIKFSFENYSVKTAFENVLSDEQVYIFNAADFSDDLSALSTFGLTKINNIIKKLSDETDHIYISLDDQTLKLSDDNISGYKRDIYLTLICEYIYMLDKNIGVVLIYEH